MNDDQILEQIARETWAESVQLNEEFRASLPKHIRESLDPLPGWDDPLAVENREVHLRFARRSLAVIRRLAEQ
ncbi:hypothetical protein SAMN06265338_13414 [Rhodoblastus acidophilus]|uniref:Uncharacterized protein n=1 Tax=Rhodoblastus acidophilus TaxID=1074 RepID=A0A212SFH3_RHOAC|nr:hypothetical protein [Rhodoblastus acidophilus]PPQ37095.1 hypothetical protein CKO16_16015 [Rhodoblastus acidophilus]RAI16720.1 hypothetical protein CH337_19880 [Rhodoblastus acidophilus]SNB84249.1 hypothetical protein SAMN06265338_13414 [Rhodoblastus acidophilus]